MFDNVPFELLWFLLGLIFLLGELMLPAFVLIFFGIGAWLTSLAILIKIAPHINIQLLIFSASSLFALWLFRKKGKGLARGRVSGHKDSASGALIGSFGVVVEDIDPDMRTGKVEVNGTNWQALSSVPLKKGTSVEVISSHNLVVNVKPINK